jgi:predicted O-methyltransferase YrrM
MGQYGIVNLDLNCEVLEDGDTVVAPMLVLRSAAEKRRGKKWYVDAGWPQKVDVTLDLHGLDEGSAALLHGLVMGIQPGVCLETGTHKGRSTHAIVSALSLSGMGHLWTIDNTNYSVADAGGFDPAELEYVTFMIGTTPDMLGEIVLPGPIEFAFLDAGHEKHELAGELEYVYGHCEDGCIVAVDNTQDDTWPGVTEAIRDFSARAQVDSISIPTLTGMDLLRITKDDMAEEILGIPAAARTQEMEV